MTASEPQAAPSATRYRLKFIPEALKKRLDQPHLPGSELHGSLQHCYKIKLRQQGYRLVYSVEDGALVVLVLAIDKREDMAAYRSALARLLAM